MKISTILLLSAASSSSAFSVSQKQQTISKPVQKIASAAATIATTLAISANVATASSLDINSNFDLNQISSSSTSILVSSTSAGDPFALPSYSESVKNKNIEIDLESVNKKILDDAASKRDDKNVNKENNAAAIDLRREEQEEEKRLERMREYAKRERQEAIEREKAETRANRWNTF